MRRTRAIIQRHKAHSGRYEAAPCDEWRIWRYLLSDHPSKSLFRPIWHLEAAAPTCQRQRSYEAVTVPVFETVSHPRLAVGDTTSSICQQLDVAKRCLIWGVKWHVSPRRSHCPNDTMRLAKRNKVTSQRRRRRIETRLPPPASEPIRDAGNNHTRLKIRRVRDQRAPRVTTQAARQRRLEPPWAASPTRKMRGDSRRTQSLPPMPHTAAGATLTTKGDVQHYASGCERADTRRPSYGSDNRRLLPPARSCVQSCANSRRASGLRNSNPDRKITIMPSRWNCAR